MGTSQSSRGPGSGVPMVPAWASDPPMEEPRTPQPAEPGATEAPSAPNDAQTPSLLPADHVDPTTVLITSLDVAPPARFRGTRRALGDYARTGETRDMRRGLGHYVRSGYSGAETAARRMGRTASTAAALYSALSNAADGQPSSPGSPLDPALLSGRTVREVMDAVVNAYPSGEGRLAKAGRAAIVR